MPSQLERCILFHSFDLTKPSLKTLTKQDNEIYNGYIKCPSINCLDIKEPRISVGKKCAVKEDKSSLFLCIIV